MRWHNGSSSECDRREAGDLRSHHDVLADLAEANRDALVHLPVLDPHACLSRLAWTRLRRRENHSASTKGAPRVTAIVLLMASSVSVRPFNQLLAVGVTRGETGDCGSASKSVNWPMISQGHQRVSRSWVAPRSGLVGPAERVVGHVRSL